MFNFFKKHFDCIGTLLLSSCLLPLYTYWRNYPIFSLQQLSSVILVFSIIFLITSAIFNLIFRDRTKASFLIYCISLLFWFSHPIACWFRDNTKLFAWCLNVQWPLLMGIVLFAALTCLYITIKYGRLLVQFNKLLNVFSFIFCAILALQIVFQHLGNTNQNKCNQQTNGHPENVKKLPNIYHILLDAHPNQKAMETIGGDLTPFYEDLEALGFFTYPESKSNYYNTPRSVASILNLQYLEGDETLLTDKALEHKSQNNIVFKKLSDLYQIHVFTSSSLIDSIYTRQFIENDYKQGNNYLLFYTLFCHTPIKHIFENCSAQHFTDYCCNSIMSTLQELANCKTKYSSTNHLFYAHFLCPHEPCVFGSKQSNNLAFKGFASVMDPLYVIDKETHNALRDNVYGIDQCVLIYLKEIIKQYETESIKPIIILHSDHSILNLIIRLPQSPLFIADNIYGNLLAIYMPDEWKVDAKDLKFINLYRFIFNHLLNSNYAYLEQKQMYGGEEFLKNE